MKRSIVIVTGASRGLGEALALVYLKQGCKVYGFSRGVSEEAEAQPDFVPVNVDLSSKTEVEMAIHRLFEQLDPAQIESITLINNAAVLAPIAPIEACKTSEIASNLNTSLIAPVLLSSLFIQKTREWAIPKTIASLTSGMANYPAASMSLYCSAKAAINMFTQCVRAEQRMAEHPVKVVAIDPGMVATDMQAHARERSGEPAFPLGAFFLDSYEQEKLASPKAAAERIILLLGQEQDHEAILRV